MCRITRPKIRSGRSLNGIKIGGNEFKISQSTDDTVLFLDGSQLSLEKALNTLVQFSFISGLSINFQKTNVYKIGQMRYMQGIFNTRHAVNWSHEPLETLGIKIPILNRNEIFNLNYLPKIEELELNMKRWRNCHMSLKGKVTIVKTLGISKLQYLASVLPLPPNNIVTNINNKIFSFIWSNRPDKIRRDIMINTFDNGGLNVPHFDTICKSIKVTWAKRYIMGNEHNSQWIKLVSFCFRSVGGKFVFRCHFDKGDFHNIKLKSSFWKDVLLC